MSPQSGSHQSFLHGLQMIIFSLCAHNGGWVGGQKVFSVCGWELVDVLGGLKLYTNFLRTRERPPCCSIINCIFTIVFKTDLFY